MSDNSIDYATDAIPDAEAETARAAGVKPPSGFPYYACSPNSPQFRDSGG